MGCQIIALANIIGLRMRIFVPCGGSRWRLLPPQYLAEIHLFWNLVV